MYGQFSANGVCPDSHALCTLDSSQVETAVGAMWYLCTASNIIVSTATFDDVSMLFRSGSPIWPPKLWNAVTAPSYLSPSKAMPSLSFGSAFIAATASLNSAAVVVGGLLIRSVR